MQASSLAKVFGFLLMTTASVAHHGGAQTVPPAVKVDGGSFGYTKADVRFMSGMIGHHAQAVVMAGWAITATRTALAAAERLAGPARRDARTALSTAVKGYTSGASDKQKVTILGNALTDLATVTR